MESNLLLTLVVPLEDLKVHGLVATALLELSAHIYFHSVLFLLLKHEKQFYSGLLFYSL